MNKPLLICLLGLYGLLVLGLWIKIFDHRRHLTSQPQPVNVEILPTDLTTPNVPKIYSSSEQLGQLFLTSPVGLSLTDQERQWLRQSRVSGYLLLSKNIDSPEQLKMLTDSIYQEATFSGLLPLVAIDQEGGAVARVPWVESTGQNEITTLKQAYKIALIRGKQLRQLGINLNFAPVVETSQTENNFILRQRRGFKNNAETLALAMLDGYQAAGIQAVVKHFPGSLGRTEIDPHLKLPQIKVSEAELIKDLTPFYYLIQHGVKGVMISHLSYPLYDSKITSASKFWTQDILRTRLGFQGLIITDDLMMKAVDTTSWLDFTKASLINGNNIIIISDGVVYQSVWEELVGQIDQSELNQAIEQAFLKVTHFKDHYIK